VGVRYDGPAVAVGLPPGGGEQVGDERRLLVGVQGAEPRDELGQRRRRYYLALTWPD